jgi:hypothetical protein
MGDTGHMAVPFAVITLLLVLVVSLLIIRTGTIALVMTGMSEEIASFQAASAFSGAGFTTDEAEQVVSSPQRRHIVKLLMRAGSVGVVTAIASLVLSFSRSQGSALPRFSYLVVGTVAIVLFLRSQWFKRGLSPALGRILTETTTLNRNEYAHLLDLREGYRVSELTVSEDGWLSHESLRNLRPADEGVVVLGITRQDGSYTSPPDPDVLLLPGDVLTVYGTQDRLTELSTRSDDDETAHEKAIEEHAQDSEEAEIPTHS